MKKIVSAILVLLLCLPCPLALAAELEKSGLADTPPVSQETAASGFANFQKVREYVPFADIPEGAGYAQYVQKAYELGLVGGTSETTFTPNGNLTPAPGAFTPSTGRAF